MKFSTQGKTCFHYRKPLFSLQGPLFSLQGFPCEKTSQGKPCFYNREWVCSVVVRLPERRPIYSKKGQKHIFQTARLPFASIHPYKPRYQLLKLGPKKLRIEGFEKSQFLSRPFQLFSAFFFSFIPIEIRHKLWTCFIYTLDSSTSSKF